MKNNTKILLILFLLLPTFLLLSSAITLAQTPNATLLPPVISTEGSLFGNSVGVSNGGKDTVVVGAPIANQTGAAYIFEYTSPTWDLVQTLTAPNGHGGDNFGWSVGIDGQVIAIGAPGVDGLTGAVYVYTHDNGVWTYQTTLTAPDAAAASQFGYAVSVSGDTIIVGAPYDDQGSYIDIGSAYIFTGSGANWTLQQQLGSYYTPPFVYDHGHFGYSVDIWGDQVIVGAPGLPAATGTGYAYPYNRVNGRWYLPYALFGPPDEDYGSSVAIYHDMIAVGSPGYDHGLGGTDSGRIHVYKWNPTSHVFEEQAGSEYDLFGPGHDAGFSVDMYRTVDLVGIPNATTEFGGPARGGAVVFRPNKVLIRETQPSPGANYGYSVATWGDYLVIGAPAENFNGSKGPVGSVYIYNLSGPALDPASPTPVNYWPTSTFAMPTATPSSTPTPSATPSITPTPTVTPTPFTPTSPPNVAPQKNFFTTDTATLTWSVVSWAVNYEVQISRNSNFTDLVTVNNPLPANPPSYTTSTLTNGTYYWRVRALRADGAKGSWSGIQMFVVSAES